MFVGSEFNKLLLIIPIGMAEGKAVQSVFEHSPVGHELIHVGDEAGVVVRLEEMNEFVHHHILQTGLGLFGEFEIEPDAARFNIAGAPSSFHLFDLPLGSLDADDGLPFFDERRDLGLHFVTIPILHDAFALSKGATRADDEVHVAFVSDMNARRAGFIADVKGVAVTTEIMAFTGDIFTWGLARLTFEGGNVFSDPREFRNGKETYGIIVYAQWGGNTNTPRWGMNGEMKVLDILALDINYDVADGYLVHFLVFGLILDEFENTVQVAGRNELGDCGFDGALVEKIVAKICLSGAGDRFMHGNGNGFVLS